MRVLLTTFGTSGDLNPYVALAHGLAARGHVPIIATSPGYREAVERQGIAFRPVRPDDPGEELFRRAMDPRRGPEVVIRRILVPRLAESYADTAAAAADADLVVTHPITFAAPIVAEERGLPWVSTVLSPISFFSRHDLPVPPPMPWVKRLEGVPGVPWLMQRVARAVTRPWMAPVRRLRAERGLPPVGHPLFEGQHSPHGVLALFSRVLGAPRPDWPPRTRQPGFLFHNAAPDPADEAEHRRLGAFLDAGPPPVVFTLGTSAVSVAGSFYAESLAAARRVGLRAVLLIGRDFGNAVPGPPGDDVIAVAHAPHDALLPRAAATVHHGGVGTLGQALRAGRPMVVVPFAHDQPDNAWRAARLGVARVIPPRRYRAARVARALAELLEDPAVVERAAEAGRIVRSESGVAGACDGIEAVAASV